MQRKGFSVLLLSLFIGLLGLACGKMGSNIKIPGVSGPYFHMSEDYVQISTVFERLNLSTGVRYNIPEYQGSYIELGPDLQSSGTLLSINVKLENILDEDLLFMDPKKLPGGRPIPSISSGELPAMALHSRELSNLTFYLSKDVFGVFIPLDFGFDVGVNNILTSRYHSNSGLPIGTISLVGQDENDEHSGIFLLLDITKRTKKLIENGKYKKFLKQIN